MFSQQIRKGSKIHPSSANTGVIGPRGPKRPMYPPIRIPNKAITRANCYGRDGRCVDPYFRTGGHKPIKQTPVKFVQVNHNTPTTKNPKLIKTVPVRVQTSTPTKQPVKILPGYGPEPMPPTKIPGHTKQINSTPKSVLTTVTDKIRSITPESVKQYITNTNVACTGVVTGLVVAYVIGRKTAKK